MIIHLVVLTQSSIYSQSKHTIYLLEVLNHYTMMEYHQHIKIFSITTFCIGNVLIYLKCHQMVFGNSSLSFLFLITSSLRQEVREIYYLQKKYIIYNTTLVISQKI